MAKVERTKNAVRNIVFGSIFKVYQILIPFIMRTIMLYTIGVEYLGLNGLFSSILQILNLAELGVGSAMVYSMYTPIANNDRTRICALMNLYKLYYRIIGGVIAIIGLVLLPFIPNLISGDVSHNVNVYIIYLLNLSASVISYWLLAYKNCLLIAHQRVDVVSKVSMCVMTIQYVIQLIVLVILRNYYVYLIVALITQILNNIITALIVTKMYPDYTPKGNVRKNEIKVINRRVRDLFTSKLGGVIVNSADTIVISTFLGLTTLAIYQNYFYIINAIIGFVAIIFNSCIAGIGNSIIVETEEKNYEDLKKFTFIIVWISGFCTCCLLCLYQSFMNLWVGEQYKLEFNMVICLCIYFYVYEINQLFCTYKDAAGIWHEDRFRPIITAFANLFMNLLLVRFIGLYGVILSTVLSTILIGTPWILHNLFSTLFHRKYFKSYLKKLFGLTIITVISCLVTYFICSFVNLSQWVGLFVKLIICLIIYNMIFIVVCRNTKEFFYTIQLIDRITRGKFKLRKIICK